MCRTQNVPAEIFKENEGDKIVATDMQLSAPALQVADEAAGTGSV